MRAEGNNRRGRASAQDDFTGPASGSDAARTAMAELRSRLDGERSLLGANAKSIPVHTVRLGHKNAAGVLQYVSTISRDMTELQHTAVQLRSSRDRLERAQRISYSGFLDWNLKTNELDCSDQVYRWYGASRDEAPTTAEFVTQVVHPEDLELTRNRLERAIRGERDDDVDHRIIQRAGTVRWVRARAELSRDAEGNPERLLGTMVDITGRKSSEDLLRREAGGQLSSKAERYFGVTSTVSGEMGVLVDDYLLENAIATAGKPGRKVKWTRTQRCILLLARGAPVAQKEE